MLKHPILSLKRAMYNIFKTLIFAYSYKIFDVLEYRAYLYHDIHRSFLYDLAYRYLYIGYKHWVAKIILWIELLIILFILLGFGLFVWKSFFDISLFFVLLKVLPFMFLMLVITFACGFARLRLPIEPFLTMFGFYGFMR
jgi:hypothetical protein